eukprot:605351_1
MASGKDTKTHDEILSFDTSGGSNFEFELDYRKKSHAIKAQNTACGNKTFQFVSENKNSNGEIKAKLVDELIVLKDVNRNKKSQMQLEVKLCDSLDHDHGKRKEQSSHSSGRKRKLEESETTDNMDHKRRKLRTADHEEDVSGIEEAVRGRRGDDLSENSDAHHGLLNPFLILEIIWIRWKWIMGMNQLLMIEKLIYQVL